MKCNLGLRQIFFNAIGATIAHFIVIITRAFIYSEVTKLKNVLKKLLKVYSIFYLIGRASSQLSSNSFSFQNDLGETSTPSMASFQEILNEQLQKKILKDDPKIINFITDDSLIFQKPESIRSRQLVQRSLSTLSDFSIEKDSSDRSTLLTVILPRSPTNFGQFIAKVADISPVLDPSERDINRTFLASPSDFKTIKIYGLHPVHHYRLRLEKSRLHFHSE